MTLAISHSEMRCYARCRRQWWLVYYRQLQPKDELPTGVVHIGGNIHLALEGMYGYNLNPLRVLRWAYDEAILLKPDHEPQLRKDLDMALAMVEGYVQWAAETGLDVGLTTVATEHEVTHPVTLHDGTVVEWRGKLDLLVRRQSDMRLLLRDFKTVGAFDKANALLLDTQMRFYALLHALANPNPRTRVDGALFLMIKRSKRTARATGPFYEQAEVSYNRHDLNSTYQRARAISQEIVTMRRRLDAGEDHHDACWASPSDFCTWGCQYFKVCSLFDDGSRVDAALEAEYQRSDPYQYYDTSRIKRAFHDLSS
jgi:PD-(D/E)XK nuclease superfamily